MRDGSEDLEDADQILLQEKRHNCYRPDAKRSAHGRVNPRIELRIVTNLLAAGANTFRGESVLRFNPNPQPGGRFAGSSAANEMISSLSQSDGGTAHKWKRLRFSR